MHENFLARGLTIRVMYSTPRKPCLSRQIRATIHRLLCLDFSHLGVNYDLASFSDNFHGPVSPHYTFTTFTDSVIMTSLFYIINYDNFTKIPITLSLYNVKQVPLFHNSPSSIN
jgi:hypothetical protein